MSQDAKRVEPAGTACAVCAEPLFVRTSGDEVVAYLHRAELADVWGEVHGLDASTVEAIKTQTGNTGPVDHLAVPVGIDEVQAETRCDFCSGPRPQWVLPVAAFDANPQQAMTADWLCCDVCARLLKKNRWDEVTRRAIEAMTAKHGVPVNEPTIVAGLKALHSQVREHQLGPVRRRQAG